MSLKIIYKKKIFNRKRFINKIFVAYLISILAIGTVLPVIRSDPGDSWWNPGWNYRKLLTMDTTKISGTLVNFPILVQMTDGALVSHAQSTGYDIVFVLYSDNTTKLNHEIEYFNGATGALYAWVNITRLSSSTNTKIWMYYGNPSCSSQQNKYGTWNSKYKAVYHLDENGLPFVDSTGNKNNITSANVNGTGMAQTGGIYKWLHFNGTTNYLVVPFTLTGAYTVEAIANPDQIIASGVVYSNEKTTSPVTGIVMGISSAGVYVTDGTLHKGLSPSSTYTPAKTTKWWADVIFTVGSKIWFYLDGANQTLTSRSYFSNAANYRTIGARYTTSYNSFWDGYIDEVRISSGTWNASWLKTCYDIQKDPASFCSRGDEESAPSGGNQPPVFEIPVPGDDSTNNPLNLTWSIPISDPEGNTFTWSIQCSNGQSNSGFGTSNGTKTLALSGLAYSTTYKVWVNATDPAPTGSGLYTRRWYTFTTQQQQNVEVLDQQQTQYNSNYALYMARWGGQSFIPTMNSLTSVQLFMRKTGSPPGDVMLSVRSSLTGVDLVSLSKPASQIPTSNDWVTFDLNDLTITLGAMYYLVLRTTGGSNTNCYYWGYGSGTPYTNGALSYSYNSGSSWTSTTYDFCFKTYGISAPSTPVLSYNPASYNFDNVVQGAIGSTNFEIWNNGTGTLTYSLSESSSWVTVTPMSGSSSGEHDTITVSIDTTGLSPGSYNYPINISSNGGSGTFTVYAMVIEQENIPPGFGSPSPANGSTGILLSLTWSIPISDPEGDLFSWTIQCSNGQGSSGSVASNGTKSLALSSLANLLSYKVWVNATDPSGSGLYTRRWYMFTTKAGNSPPVFGSPSPVNGSLGNLLSLTWSIPINDPEGNLFSWSIQCSNGQVNSGIGASNGTKYLVVSGLGYATTYKVWVNATDPTESGLYTMRWFTFTTKPANGPPVFGSPFPVNGSTGNLLSLTWSIPISDPEGDLFSWTIQCNNGQATSVSSASNGTKSLALFSLTNLTTYIVWVNATDPSGSGLYTHRWYMFTTKAGNSPPVFGSPSPVNDSTGNWLGVPPAGSWIPWNIPINDPEGNRFSWTIQCSNGQTASGTSPFNGTVYLAISTLSYSTTYKVWVNATDPTGSGLYMRRWYTFTTRRSGNNPPMYPRVPSPANCSISTGSQLSPSWMNLTWSIRINDLENNSFDWSIQCSNGQMNSSTGAKNGTKSLKLIHVAYSTTFKIWVNATDPTGSGLYIRRWFTFTTKVNDPPIFGTTSLTNGSTGNSLSSNWWGIFINDPEANPFSWTIQCNNGQGSSGSGASNGTKSLTLSGLMYSTTYKVWVNATDPAGGGLYTRRWFTFTTQGSGGNNPPVFGVPSPVNSSSGSRLSLTWSISISDSEGTVFSWTIQCNNGQGTSGSGASNGTKSLTLSGLMYSTTYKIWVNATDPTGSTLYTRKWYTFTTEPIIPINIPTPKPWSPVTSASGETRVGPSVADVNNDGRIEIVRSGLNGIVVFNGTSGTVVWNKITAMWDSHIPIEIIDLNNDGYLDVISSYDSGTRALSGKDGSQLWYNANAPLYNKHAVAGDINADGYPEVFVCTAGANSGSPQGWVTALTHDGQIFAKVHTYFPCYGGLTLGDTNNDGVYELFMGERNIGYDGNVVGKGVRAFWASNLTERWCHPEMLSSSNCPTLVDTNKDGILEVVALAQTGGNGIAVYKSSDGSVIHYSNIPGLRCHSNPTVYDIDGDGNLEIIVGGGSDAWGKPIIWDLYTWSLEAWLPFDCWEPPAIVDINGDGRVEILECTITNISIFDDNYVFRGSIPLNNNRSGSGYYGMSMIVAQDIDNDNLLELVINRYNQVYVYDTEGAAPNPRALSQFSYYSQHRGRSPYYTIY